MNLVQGNYGGDATSSGTYTPKYSSAGMFGSALGGAAGGAMLGSMLMPGIGTGIGALAGGALGLFSDKRLKTNIKQIDFSENGLPIYQFNYIGDEKTTYVGYIAQEVQALYPEAVILDASGYLKVNYAIL